jgi:CHAT domain-containing protein/Tfp pilus assembly protein PilF
MKTIPAALLILTLAIAVSAQTPTPTTSLEPGKPIEQTIGGGEKHSYNLTLAPGSYGIVDVEQKSINLAITITGTDGQKLRLADMTGTGFSEEISLIGGDTTNYRIEVHASDKEGVSGGYAIKLKETRSATDRDKARVEAETLNEAGMQLLANQRNRESRLQAIDKFQQSLTFWRAAKNNAGEAGSLYLLSHTFNEISEYEKAHDAAKQALPLAQAAGEQRLEAWLHDQIGSSYNGRGENKKALDSFLEALRLRQIAKDPVGLGNTLNNLGITYNAVGDLQKSLYYMEQVAPLMREVRDRLKESTVLGNICVINTDLGHYQESIKFCNQSLKIKREINDESGAAVTLSNFGNVYAHLGNYQRALELYEEAREIHKRLGRRESEAVTLNNIGYAYAQLGDPNKAKELYEEALASLREAGSIARVAIALNNIGANYSELKEYRKALDILLQALSLRTEKDDPNGRAITLNNTARCYDNLGDKQKALEQYTEALRLHRSVGNQRRLAATLKNFGVFQRKQGETAKALEYLNESRTINARIGDLNSEAIVLSELAELELNRGNLVEARKLIEQAIASIESLRINLKSQSLRTSFLASVRNFYETNIDVLMRLHQQRPGEGFAVAALEISEKSRARSLLELLREARAEIQQGVDPLLIDRQSHLRQAIANKAEQQTRLLSGKYTEQEASVIAKELDALTIEYDQVQSNIRQVSPRYAALIEPQPIRVEEIQKRLLDADTLLLEYALGEEKSYVWAVTSDEVKSFELPGRAAIEQSARRVYQLLTERGVSVSEETLAQRKGRVERADAEYTEASVALSRMLLGPLASELKQKRLAIVAEGVLQYVPFAALPSPVSATPLIVDHEVLNLPSASVLAVLREETANRKPASKAVAVLADPVFSASDPRLSKNHGTAVADNSSLAEAYRSAAESGVGNLTRLRFSRKEAEEIARLAGDNRNLKALDFAASRAVATDAKLSDYRIVHFATHGLINNQHPELSGVVLSLVDEQGRPQNGFLRLYDVYNLKLNSDLVVLSACQTALGKEIKGEGLIGLTRGFMYAGAPRVVASLWRIDDRASADVMTRFYSAMLKDGMRPAAALRAAQISMLRDKRWQAPHYWAAFTIQGEWLK